MSLAPLAGHSTAECLEPLDGFLRGALSRGKWHFVKGNETENVGRRGLFRSDNSHSRSMRLVSPCAACVSFASLGYNDGQDLFWSFFWRGIALLLPGGQPYHDGSSATNKLDQTPAADKKYPSTNLSPTVRRFCSSELIA